MPDAGPSWRCGDGVQDVDAGETCEDGNTVDGDGCGASCQFDYPDPYVETEPNDVTTQATQLPTGNVVVQGTLVAGGGGPDVDLHAFQLDAVVNLRLETLGAAAERCDPGVDTLLRLLGPDGARVLAEDDDGGAGGCSRIDAASHPGARALRPGTYFAEVRLREPGPGGPYRLRVTHVDRCGNGIRTNTEACDDGNDQDADGCESDCLLPACRNGIRDPGEFCTSDVVSVLQGEERPQVSVVSADVDGDGWLDLVSVENSIPPDGGGLSPVNVFRGQPGEPPAFHHRFLVAPSPCMVLARDLDGDGDQDLVITSAQTTLLTYALGRGDGTFQTTTQDVGFRACVGAMADVDGDGEVDLVLTEMQGWGLLVLKGQGGASFQPLPVAVGPGKVRGVAVADADGDGDDDLAMTSMADGTVSLHLGNPDGSLSPGASHHLGVNPWGLGWEDVSGDGVGDLVVAVGGDLDQTGAGVAVLTGQGNGWFGPPVLAQFTGLSGPNGVVLADFNSDGTADVAVSGYGGQQVYVVTMLGNGALELLGRVLVGSLPAAVIAPDLNRDRVPDLVCARASMPELPFLVGGVAVALSDP
jgi:cysteine-rich repeat protein